MNKTVKFHLLLIVTQSKEAFPSLEIAKHGNTNGDSSGSITDELKRFLCTVMTYKLHTPSDELPISGVFHWIFTDPSEGITMQDLASHAAKAEFRYLTIPALEQLDSYLFKEVYNMLELVELLIEYVSFGVLNATII